MLIENIQENEHFALLLTIKRDSTDSEPSEHSHKTPNDMATSSSADMVSIFEIMCTSYNLLIGNSNQIGKSTGARRSIG